MVPQISPLQLAERLKLPDPPQLIDVREPWEFAIVHMPGAQLRVLGQIGTWSKELPREAQYVLICHHGARSQMACQLLQQLGFDGVSNLAGGTDAWATQVDPTMARY